MLCQKIWKRYFQWEVEGEEEGEEKDVCGRKEEYESWRRSQSWNNQGKSLTNKKFLCEK